MRYSANQGLIDAAKDVVSIANGKAIVGMITWW